MHSLVRLPLARALALGAVAFALVLIVRPAEGDFPVFWHAARLAFETPYDAHVLTAAQDVPAHAGLKPFSYLPSFLLFLLPFGWLDYWFAFALFVGSSAFLLTWAASKIARWPEIAVLNGAAIYALGIAQTTVLLAALAILTLVNLKRPLLSGVLLGLAVSIKPHLIGFLPLGLLISGNWRVVVYASAAAVGLAALAAVVFGPLVWLDWFNSLDAFLEVNRAWRHFQVIGSALDPLIITAALTMVIYAFRTQDVGLRLVAVGAAGIFCSPHVMSYDSALIAPGVLAMLTTTQRWAALPSVPVMLGFAAAWHSPWPVLLGAPATVGLHAYLNRIKTVEVA